MVKAENLSCISEPILGPKGILNYVHSLPSPPTLQHGHMPHLYPYTPMERSPAAMSPVSEPGRRSVGQVPLPTGMQTLLVQRLQAHLQRPHQHPPPPEQAVAAALDSGHLSALSRLFVAAYREGGGGPYPDQLSVVLVAAECCAVV